MTEGNLQKLARLIRYFILISTTAAGSGHPTTSMSATDLMTVLFFNYLRYDLDNTQNPVNDRVIFSKGHASPLFYAIYAAAGKVTEKELLTLRTFDSALEGHPVPRFRFTEAATGSLGQGLSVGVGEALSLKMNHESGIMNTEKKQNIHNSQFSIQYSIPHVFVLLGDGELAEGSVWEAAAAAAYYKLNNLIAIADINGLGQSSETMYNRDIDVYVKRFESFGWRVIPVENGHDLKKIDKAFSLALAHRRNDAPTILIARTIKGKGVSFLEGKHGWHGKALSSEELGGALKELGKVDTSVRGVIQGPTKLIPESGIMNDEKDKKTHDSLFAIQYSSDKPTSTRKAFGNALVKLGKIDSRMVVLDADVQNSTYTEFFAKAYPERFFQMFIAEQNMVGTALGMAKRGLHPWLATFACFLTRAYDQVRMAALSQADIKICGSHAGVSIGADGGSQMGLEDLAMFRAVAGSTVLYPSDAVSAERLVEQMAGQKGIVYMRTTRSDTPILYDAREKFVVGGSKVFDGKRSSMTVVAAGITLHEALKAQKQLADEGIGVRVIDCYSIKPIDASTLQKAAKETKGIVVVEDHYPEGGLGEAVLTSLAPLKVSPCKVVHLAVRKTPRSAKPSELLAHQEIDAAAIIKAVKSL